MWFLGNGSGLVQPSTVLTSQLPSLRGNKERLCSFEFPLSVISIGFHIIYHWTRFYIIQGTYATIRLRAYALTIIALFAKSWWPHKLKWKRHFSWCFVQQWVFHAATDRWIGLLIETNSFATVIRVTRCNYSNAHAHKASLKRLAARCGTVTLVFLTTVWVRPDAVSPYGTICKYAVLTSIDLELFKFV